MEGFFSKKLGRKKHKLKWAMIQSRAVCSTSEISSALAISKYGSEIGGKEITAEVERVHTEAQG